MELKRIFLAENIAIVTALKNIPVDELIEMLLSEKAARQQTDTLLKKEKEKYRKSRKLLKQSESRNRDLAEEINNLKGENLSLSEKLRDTAEYYKSTISNLYGSKSEKLRSIMNETVDRLENLISDISKGSVPAKTEEAETEQKMDPSENAKKNNNSDPDTSSQEKKSRKDKTYENPDGSYRNAPNPRKGNKGHNKGKKQSGVKEKQIQNLKNITGYRKDIRTLTPEELLAACEAGCLFHHWETVTHVEYVPGKLVVHEETVAVYKKKDGTGTIRASRESAELFRSSLLSPSLGAFLITSKYMDFLPCYHIHKKLERMGLSISRQTITNWNRMLGDRKLRRIYKRMKKYLVTELHFIQADETPQRVQDDGLEANSVGRVWLFRSSEHLKNCPQVILFVFRRGRSIDDLETVITDEFSGYVTTDAYCVYHSLDDKKEGVYVTNCWAHLRRFFADSVKAMEKKTAEQKQAILNSIPWKALSMIRDIYHEENKLKELPADERRKQRQLNISPLIDNFFKWIKEAEKDDSISRKSKTMRGIQYGINQETYLRRFLEDGNIPIDNSASERLFRNYVLLRDRCGQITSLVGAEAAAITMSVVETAKANGLIVEQYIEYLLEQIALAEKEEKRSGNPLPDEYYDQFLPWSDTLPEYLRIPTSPKNLDTANVA